MSVKKIGLVFGGKSPEHEVSIISARNIYNAIDTSKFDVTLIGISQAGKWYLENAANLQDNSCVIGKDAPQLAVVFGAEHHKLIRLDNHQYIDALEAVFPITHGPNGEDGTLQGIFLQLDIPFVGPGVLGSAVAMDKDFTKRILRDAGIGHAKGITFYKHEIKKISYAETTNELRNYFICETVQYGFICWCKQSYN
jgi:D-alanine-D-alanine ligase